MDLNSNEIRDYNNQGQEIWCYQMLDENDNEVETGPKLQLKVYFSWSDVQRFEALRYDWQNYIAEDIVELEQLREYVQNMTTPFGFLEVMMAERG